MLDSAQKARLLDLFAEGASLPTSERLSFAHAACGDDPVLLRELLELLQVEGAELGGFLDLPVVVPAGDAEGTSEGAAPGEASPAAPPQIDGYAGFELIARGGMGAVYKAMQLRPVRRPVAVKTIAWGLVSDSVLARFEAERQALALMSHPYIASVYDAGVDRAGSPYFAMEYVDGRAITEYCKRERLSLDERLRLFIQVCEAVDYAHRRGVLHRDLKPSNILVSRGDGQARPKIIDFGIAKALHGPLGERSIHTAHGSFLGTPDYMSPEQLDGAPDGVDTRSDVYSLGVVLYELVTQSLPIEASGSHDVGLLQLTRLLRETLPVKPSTRLRELQAAGGGPVKASGSCAQWLRRLQGDLDWVVMKALEKEPRHRYGSPHELAADLESFLGHRPVAAGPPSGLYRVRKFARRYRVQVGAAALVFLALVLGLFGTLWFLIESKANESQANRQAAEAVAARRQSEGIRLATEAAMLAAEQPNKALLLAVAASELTADHAVEQTIYEILPHHRDLQVLDGHDFGVQQVLFLPDGRLLSRGDSTVLLWDSERGTVLRRFALHAGQVERMAVDPPGRRLLTTSTDATARIWDVDSGECLLCLDESEDRLPWGEFSPDGRRVAVASMDGVVRVYDAASGALELELRHPSAVSSVTFGPRGARLVTRAEDRVTRLWSAGTGALERELDTPRWSQPLDQTDNWPYGQLAWFPAAERIVSLDAGQGEASLSLHAIDGTLLAQLPNACEPRFPGGGRMLFTSLEPAGWGTVDLGSGQVERHGGAQVRFLAPAPGGRLAVGVDARSELCLVDLDRDAVRRGGLGAGEKYHRPPVAFSPDGESFAVGNSTVRVFGWAPRSGPIDLPGEAVHLSRALCGRPQPLVVLRDGDATPPRWTVWSLESLRPVCSLQREDLERLELAPSGTRLVGVLAPSATAGRRVATFDLEGRLEREIQVPEIEGGNLRHTISEDGRRSITIVRSADWRTSGEGLMLCHDLETGELLASRPDPGGYVAYVSGVGSTSIVLCFMREQSTEVHDWRTGEVIARFRGRPGWNIAGAISPDGRYLLGLLGAPRAVVWDLADDAAAAPIAEYGGLVGSDNYRGGFLSDGLRAWALCTNEVHLFEARTGEGIAVLRLDGPCAAVVESADGRELITVTVQGRCQRWPLDPRAEARRRAVGSLAGDELPGRSIEVSAARLAAEREYLVSHPTPRRYAQLAERDLTAGDLDGAIDWYQRGQDLGVMTPLYADFYLRLVELRCRRLARADRDSEGREADRAGAMAALERALTCGASREELLALPGIDQLRASPRLMPLMAR